MERRNLEKQEYFRVLAEGGPLLEGRLADSS